MSTEVLVSVIDLIDGRPTKVSESANWADGGLAVTRGYGDYHNSWVITHCASGTAVYRGFKTRKAAIATARRLLPMSDWTRSRTAMRRDKALKAACKALLVELVEDESTPVTFQPEPMAYPLSHYVDAEFSLEPMSERPRLEPEPTLCRAYSPVVILLGFLAFWVIVGYAWGLRWW